MAMATSGAIKAIDRTSVHQITSGQVVVDLQTAVKELVENSLDAGATSIEIRFKDYGLTSVEVIDNGSGIAPEDYPSIGLKHHTSKLETFEDISTVQTFGFRGEALSSLCALCESVTVTTATENEAPMGTVVELAQSGEVASSNMKVARQRGTTVMITKLFAALPVRRKELERTAKREFGKALNLMHAYALVPCANENKGVRLVVSNQAEGGKRVVQLRSNGSASTRASVTALWGPKALDNIVDLDLHLSVTPTKSVLRRQQGSTSTSRDQPTTVRVKGLVSKFAVACGRGGTDRQFFFINGRPCAPSKVQKSFNEVYRSFNATQSPFIVADFQLPTKSCDINVSPDKRTILLHSEENLIHALKLTLEETFAPTRSTYDLNDPVNTPSQRKASTIERLLHSTDVPPKKSRAPNSEASSDPEPTLVRKASGSHLVGPSVEDRSSSSPPVFPTPSSRPGYLVGCEAVVDTHTGAVRYTQVDVHIDEDGDEQRDEGEPEIEESMLFDELDLSAPILSESTPNPSEPLFLPSRSPSPATSAPVLASTPPPQSTQIWGVPTLLRPDSASSSSPASSCSNTAATGESMHQHQPVIAVLSTSRAAWNRRRNDADANPDTNDDSPRPHKKARRSVSPAPVLAPGTTLASARASVPRIGSAKPNQKSEKGLGSRGKLRQQLLSFARTGSQVAPIDVESNDEEDGEKCEDSEDALEDDADPSDAEMIETAKTNHADIDSEDTDENGPVADGGDEAGSTEPDTDDVEMVEGPNPEVSDFNAMDTIDTSSSFVLGDRSRLEGDRDLEDNMDIIGHEDGDQDADEDAEQPVYHPEIIRTDSGGDIILRVDLPDLSRTWTRFGARRKEKVASKALHHTSTGGASSGRAEKDEAGLTNTSEESAMRALSRIISKDDFGIMECLGQFNHGFIIARRRKANRHRAMEAEHDDLFIIDQHAADEKYNFETLQKTDKISAQMLYRPIPLELTAADELLALENVPVLQANGFELSVDEDALPGRGERIKITAQPVSKKTVFDMKDLEELLHLMRDTPTGTMVRCSKARAMYASRACRKSVMVGMPLKRVQMTKVVRHMGTMDQPWNCPHGRPTMRHLLNLAEVGDHEWFNREIEWKDF